MLVVTVHNCPARLRGELSLWLQEIDTGVYVGHVSTKIRSLIWKRVEDLAGSGTATMIYSTKNEQKFSYRIHNCNAMVKDFDGLALFYKPQKSKPEDNDKRYYSKYRGRKYAQQDSVSNVRGEKWMKRNYLVLDIETTGLSLLEDFVIEVALIVVRDGRLVETWSSLIKADCKLPLDIQRLTGINDAMLDAEGISAEDACRYIMEIAGDLPIVGHNVNFDIGFLRAMFRKVGLQSKFNHEIIDTMKLSKRILRNRSSYKLANLVEELQLDIKIEGHRALKDAQMTQVVFEKLIEIVSAQK